MTGSWWPWLALAGLGAFHGVNPAMGWLFAVALGLHRGSLRDVLAALPPIALGHALSIALVVGIVIALGVMIEGRWIYRASGLVLIGWAAWHQLYGHRHRVRVGMTAGFAGLTLWSFLMATAHGAGLMILPVIMPLCIAASPLREVQGSGSAAVTLAAVGLHTAAMLGVIAVIAVAVYRWIGLAILRTAWINFNIIWTVCLVATGLILLVMS
jgi:hypothetical protein